MSYYNLIEEKWIPIRYLNGSRDELGIRDTLVRAKEIHGIEDGSPLVVASIHRFLLAVLYRALEGPTSIDESKRVFLRGLPQERILDYLDRWRNRFWLLDEHHPFAQVPDFEPASWRAWTALAAEHNADNAKVLFDHVNINKAGSIPPRLAIRWILSTMTFSVSCGKSELSHTGTAPSATGVLAIPLGRDLHDTLLFCLIPQNREVLLQDIPIWERTPDSLESLRSGLKRTESGFSDRLLWRSRSIRLMADKNGDIDRVAFASGVGYESGGLVDPMFGYRIDEKRGKLPLQFKMRGIWRDYDSLLPDEANLAPLVIAHARALGNADISRFPRAVMVLGQVNDKAKIEFWRMEMFALPPALAGDLSLRSEIKQLLSDAEKVSKDLWHSCRIYARSILSRGDREPDKKDVAVFIKQLPIMDSFWSLLESRFHELISDLTLDRDSYEVRASWLNSISNALSLAWKKHVEAVSGGDAWSIRALAKAEMHLKRSISELRAMEKALLLGKE